MFSSNSFRLVRAILVICLFVTFLSFLGKAVSKYKKNRIATELRTEDKRTFLFPSIALCAFYNYRRTDANNPRHMFIKWAKQSFAVNKTHSKDVFVHYGAEPDVELGINSSANGTWTFFRLHMMTGNISCELYNPQKQTAFGWANDLIFGLDTKRIPAKVKYFQMFSNSAANLNLIAGETFGTNFETVPADGAGPHDRHLKGKQILITFGEYIKLPSAKRPCYSEEEEANKPPFGKCIETYMYDKWGCMVYDSGCWEEGQNARAMLSDLQSKTEEEIIEESGCVPPCKITDNQVQLKGIVSIPRKRDLHSDVDMELHIYNKKAYKIVKEEYLVYDSYSFFADMGGLVGVLLGLSCVTAFDAGADLLRWSARRVRFETGGGGGGGGRDKTKEPLPKQSSLVV